MDTDATVGAEPTNTEEVVEAESTEEVSTDESWGEERSDDTLGDDLSTTEEEVVEEVSSEKTPLQTRFDTITREKNEAIAREATAKNTSDFLMQELNKRQHATPTIPVKEEVEPVWEDFAEKYDDSDEATREFLLAKQDYGMKKHFSEAKNSAAVLAQQSEYASKQQEFQAGSYKEDIMAKFPDFQAKVFHPTVIFDDPDVRHLIMSSPQKYDIAYRLASDTELRAQLNASSPAVAGAIIGDLQRLYSSPVNKRFKTKQPSSVPTIGKASRATTLNDTDMPIDEFLKKQDAKQAVNDGW